MNKKRLPTAASVSFFLLAATPFCLVIALIVLGVLLHPESVCRNIPDSSYPCSRLEMFVNDLNVIGVFLGFPALIWMGFVYILTQISSKTQDRAK